MDEEHFHTVAPESLKKIRISDILKGQNIVPEVIDYSVPVQTSNPGMIQHNQESWLPVVAGGVHCGHSAVSSVASGGYICGASNGHSGHCH